MKTFFVVACSLLSLSLCAQGGTSRVERGGAVPLSGTIDLADTSVQDWAPKVQTISEQMDGSRKFGEGKQKANDLRKLHEAQRAKENQRKKKAQRGANAVPVPVMGINFTANNTQGTPADNHIAISNDNKIVSVVNTNFRVYDTSGVQLQVKSLSVFANALGMLTAISDPRVIYDPVADRFIVVFFSGGTSQTTTIIVAFSQTADPAGQWNLYALNGNYLNDSTWSDYPVLSLSDKDLFMTFNHLIDNSDWKTGFRYSAIWQIDKQSGYNGDSLRFDYWHHIAFNGKPVWNICAVRGGNGLAGQQTYFLSVRPGDVVNDSVFLHTISDSYQSGQAQLTTQVVQTDTPYGIAPDARQRDGQYLATNDARVLDAFVANDKIQYVQNTVTPYANAGVYVGEIDHPESSAPVAIGQIIADEDVDFGYPSIAYMGNNAFDNRAMITCSYSSADTFPGTAVFYKDAHGNISDMLNVKAGERQVDVLTDTVERWGDYTGIQKKYNEPNVAWIAGSYVAPTKAYRTWLAQVINPDSAVVSSLPSPAASVQPEVFPNPASEMFQVKFETKTPGSTTFTLYDASGKLVRTLLQNDRMKAGTSIFSFHTQYLANGMYLLQISQGTKLLHTEKIIIRR